MWPGQQQRQQRLKRRLVRDLVAENVALRDQGAGRAALTGRRRWPRAPRWMRRGLLTLATVAPFALWAGAWLGAERLPDKDATASFAPRALDPPRPPAAQPLAPAEPEPARVEPQPVATQVFPLGVRRIVLDAGHGGGNLGTRTPQGLVEKHLTLDIAQRLRDRLVHSTARPGRGFEVLMTREEDRAVTLQERASYANGARADIFVSIHINWIEGLRASGLETYYLGPSDDPFVNGLARQENHESGHTLAELRTLLDGLYAGMRQDRSRELAAAVHRELFGALARVNPQLVDRGIKTAPFIVLLDTEMPAILAEVATMSSDTEVAMLAKPLYRQYIADALAAGIERFASDLERPDDNVVIAGKDLAP